MNFHVAFIADQLEIVHLAPAAFGGICDVVWLKPKKVGHFFNVLPTPKAVAAFVARKCGEAVI